MGFEPTVGHEVHQTKGDQKASVEKIRLPFLRGGYQVQHHIKSGSHLRVPKNTCQASRDLAAKLRMM